MRRIAAVLSLLVFSVTFSLLPISRAAACPVSMTVPLRGLYLESDIVVIGRIGKPGKWTNSFEAVNGINYRMYSRGVPIVVEETIKGVPPKELSVSEDWSKFLSPEEAKNSQSGAPQFRLPDESESYSQLSENKERRLFFLGGTPENGYHENYSADRLFIAPEKLDLYISRLRELKNIYMAGKADRGMIVEWLVSMTEDPATRYEGAFELRMALTRDEDSGDSGAIGEPENREEEYPNDAETQIGASAPAAGSPAEFVADPAGPAADSASAPKDEVKTAESGLPDPIINNDSTAAGDKLVVITSLRRPFQISLEERPEYDPYGRDKDFAKLLTPAQKERLIAAFINIRFNYEPQGEIGDPGAYYQILTEGDMTLLDTVARLRDRRVADRIISELPAVARLDPGQASDIMEPLGQYFDDKKLTGLIEKYSAIKWNSAGEMIDEEEDSYDIPEPAPQIAAASGAVELNDRGEANKPEIAAPPLTVNDGKTENAAAEEEKPFVPAKTYAQRRIELMDMIMARIGEIMAKE